MTALAFLVVLIFVCVKQEFAWMESELITGAHDEAANNLLLLSTERSVTQRIILTYASVLGSVGDMKARGPALLRDVTGLAESMSGGVSMGFYFIKCALGWDFYTRLLGGILLPLFLVVLSAVYTLTRGLRSSETERFSSKFLTGCLVMIVYLTYSSQTKHLLLGRCATFQVTSFFVCLAELVLFPLFSYPLLPFRSLQLPRSCVGGVCAAL
jgi:hypothetical protein